MEAGDGQDAPNEPGLEQHKVAPAENNGEDPAQLAETQEQAQNDDANHAEPEIASPKPLAIDNPNSIPLLQNQTEFEAGLGNADEKAEQAMTEATLSPGGQANPPDITKPLEETEDDDENYDPESFANYDLPSEDTKSQAPDSYQQAQDGTATDANDPTLLGAQSAATTTEGQQNSIGPNVDLAAFAKGTVPSISPEVDIQSLLFKISSPSAQSANQSTGSGSMRTPVPSQAQSNSHTVLTSDEETEYQNFLNRERELMNNWAPGTFPDGSRMFIGNLPSDRVSKRVIWRIFRKHGEVAQVSLKQAYGFVQYMSEAECSNALANEQGTLVNDRPIHLEISKPQKRRENENKRAGRRGRSPDYRGRSPEYRGRSPPRRYDQSDYRQDRRDSRRGRADEWPSRTYRERSPVRGYTHSPPRKDAHPIPQRSGIDVPELQIAILDDVDRDFIWRVESAFRTAGIKTDTISLSPRVSLQSIIRQVVAEGSSAILTLTRRHEYDRRISIQTFDRSQGPNNVHFNEYDMIDIQAGVELILRLKRASLQAQTPNTSQYSSQPGVTNALASNPQLAALAANLDPVTLQSVLQALGKSQQPAYGAPMMPQVAQHSFPPQSNPYAPAMQQHPQPPQTPGFLNQSPAPYQAMPPTPQAYYPSQMPPQDTNPAQAQTSQQIAEIMAKLQGHR